MKVFTFMLIVTILSVGINSSESEEKQKDHIQEWIDQCAEELVITEDKIKEYEAMTEPPLDQLGMCLTACVLEKTGLLIDGKIDKKTADAVMKDFEGMEGMEGVPEIAKKCYAGANEKTDKCEIAGEWTKCIHDELGAMESAT